MEPLPVFISSMPFDWVSLTVSVAIPVSLAFFSHWSSKKAEKRANAFTLARQMERDIENIKEKGGHLCGEVYGVFMQMRVSRLSWYSARTRGESRVDAAASMLDGNDKRNVINFMRLHQSIDERIDGIDSEFRNNLALFFKYCGKLEEVVGKENFVDMRSTIQEVSEVATGDSPIPEEVANRFVERLNEIEEMLDDM